MTSSTTQLSTQVTPQQHVSRAPGMPFLIRVLWFFLIGWHVTLWWVLTAWLFNITIIGLPVGIWMLDRVPLVLTLRTQRGYTVTEVDAYGAVQTRYRSTPQISWVLRLLYFVFIGWWFSLIWSLLGWLLCVTIIGLPLGVLMLNRLPNVTTMMRQ
jgi:uncharacterized membrane protein YccF (DUF307 family)